MGVHVKAVTSLALVNSKYILEGRIRNGWRKVSDDSPVYLPTFFLPDTNYGKVKEHIWIHFYLEEGYIYIT